MRVIYTSKGMSKKVWGARYTLGARYLSKNTVIARLISVAGIENTVIWSLNCQYQHMHNFNVID